MEDEGAESLEDKIERLYDYWGIVSIRFKPGEYMVYTESAGQGVHEKTITRSEGLEEALNKALTKMGKHCGIGQHDYTVENAGKLIVSGESFVIDEDLLCKDCGYIAFADVHVNSNGEIEKRKIRPKKFKA